MEQPVLNEYSPMHTDLREHFTICPLKKDGFLTQRVSNEYRSIYPDLGDMRVHLSCLYTGQWI